MTKRMQSIFPSLIAETQSAFAPGKTITYNVLITHETLHYLKTTEEKKWYFMAVKIDMRKAYDKIELGFLQAVLERLRFHNMLITWIMECVMSESYSFLINGGPQGNVILTRGLRQGDPLSPYLFILCSEILSGLCHRVQSNGTLTGTRVACYSPQVNHLLFAHDTMFFCKSDATTC